MMKSLLRLAEKYGMIALLTPLSWFIRVRNNRVTIVNEVSRRFAGSPKAVADALAAEGKHEVFYAVYDAEKYSYLREMGITPVTFRSFKYFVTVMSSKVFVSNAGGYSYIPKKKKQYFINTWHGGGAYKKIGLDVLDDDFMIRRDISLLRKKTDCFLSSGAKFSGVLTTAFLFPKEKIYETGLPRNDILLSDDADKRSAMKRMLGIGENERLVVFAPTFRKKGDQLGEMVSMDYGIDPEVTRSALKKRFGGSWVFAYRLHPKIAVQKSDSFMGTLNLSGYEDMQDILLAADVLITDFSSSMWDFMLTGRPCFIYAADLQEYINTTEVYTPVSEWPFPKSTDNGEFEASILGFDEKKYKEDCRRHYEALGGHETGRATKLVVERINEVSFGK